MKRLATFLVLFFIFSASIFSQNIEEIKIQKQYSEQGIKIKIKNKGDNLIFFYKLYKPSSNSYSEGIIGKKELLVEYNTEICLWAKNEKGNLSKAKYFRIIPEDKEDIMQIISPLEGNWNQKQKLIIDAVENTQIMYSIDGRDPEKFGLIYTEPILIEKNGVVNLWIKAINSDGTRNEKKLEYSVSEDGKISPYNRIIRNDSIYKDFSREPYKILSWNFIEFNLNDSVNYLIKDSTEDLTNNLTNIEELSRSYTGPIFLDRMKDAVLYWYSPSYNAGNINKIEFPRKPLLFGVPVVPQNKGVELNFDDERYRYFLVEKGTPEFFYQFNLLKELNGSNIDELQLKEFKNNKFNFDVDFGKEKKIIIKIPVFYKSIFQGNFYADFIIDKLPPKEPKVICTPSFSPTNKPVSLYLPKGDDIVTKIDPPVYKQENNKIILTGQGGEKTIYNINIFRMDRAGNKSSSIKKTITIEKNTLFVDSTSKSKKPTGNASSPFVSIPDALAHIEKICLEQDKSDNEKWKIYLRGNATLSEAILVSKNIKLISNSKRSIIKFPKNTGFVVNDAYLELENCDLVREEHPTEPRSVPIIYASHSTIKLNGVNIKAIEGQSILNAFYSHLDIANTKIESEQTNLCTIINLDNCSAVFSNTNMIGRGSSIVGISAASSDIELDNISSTLRTGFTARFIQAWDSQIVVGKIKCTRLPERKYNKDVAIWFNRKSTIDIKFQPIIMGYEKSFEREP